MKKVTKYELTPMERSTFRAVADAISNVCKHYDDECQKENIDECPFSCFCPYYGDKEKEVFSDVVRSIPIMLEDIELNENNN